MKKQYKVAIGAAVSGALLLAGCDTALSGVDPTALQSALSELNTVAESVGDRIGTLEIPAVDSAAPIVAPPEASAPVVQAPTADIPGVEVAVQQPAETGQAQAEQTQAPAPAASTKVTPKPASTKAPAADAAPAKTPAKPAAASQAAQSVKPADVPATAKPSASAADHTVVVSNPPASVAPASTKTPQIPAAALPEATQTPATQTPMPLALSPDIHIAGNNATLTVNAEETVTAKPDIAKVFLGVKAQGASAAAAQEENSKLTESFLTAIKGAGVLEDDIETSNFNVYQDYENPAMFVAETSYLVTMRDITKVGDIIDAAIKAGANTSYSLSFDVDDRDSLYLTALAKAVQAVQMKAKTVAEAGGFTIKSTKAITEGGTSSYYDRGTAVEYAAAAAGDNAKMSVVPGDVKVTASVSGEFDIE